MSTDEEYLKYHREQAWKRAGIPDWTQRFMDPARGIIAEISDASTPANVVSKWEDALADGRIVDSDDLDLRGRGLWIMGEKRRAEILACALLQRHILSGTVKTGCYLSEYDWLESESPDAEMHRTFPTEAELLVLVDVGEGYRAASGWADATVRKLLRLRDRAGLPTLVQSTMKPQDAIHAGEHLPFYVVKVA